MITTENLKMSETVFEFRSKAGTQFTKCPLTTAYNQPRFAAVIQALQLQVSQLHILTWF